MNPDTPVEQGSATPACRQRHVACKRYVPVLLTLAIGAGFSLFVLEKAVSNQDRHFRHEFEHVADNYSLLITSWIESRFQALGLIRSFYYGSKTIDRDEFASFVAPYFKGRNDIHAVLWAPLVRGPQRKQFEQTVRAEGPGNFDIMESTEEGQSFEPRKDFFSVYRTSQPLLVLVAGLLVTVLTALCFLMGIGRTLRVERLVRERTQQLRTANDSLEAEIAEGKRIQSQKENLLSLLSVANNELIESNEKLSRSNQELEDFAYVASHDLQEPLRKVTAFGDRLKAKYSEVLDETGRDYVERMQNAARRMSTLINDLLTYSRVSSKAQPFGPVDLEETVREVLEDLDVHIEELNATVQVGPLPCVQADAIQMRQLMQNLISNALKFHKPDTPPEVKIYSRPVDEDATEATASGSGIEIVVKDNGIGFEEKHAAQIFRMFQRLHGHSEYEGTGVGLAICRKIAERHGAAITAKGTAGVGARFALRFASGSVLSQSTATNCKGIQNV